MDKPLQSALMHLLHKLPPGSFSLQRMTIDQGQGFLEVKRHYLWMYQSFDNYFSGRGQERTDGVPELVLLMRNGYLKFYQVIQWGWTHIVDEYKLLDRDLPFEGPGDALLQAMTKESLGPLAPLDVPYHRFSPNKQRDLAKLNRRIQKCEALGQTHDRDVLLKQHKSKSKSSELFLEFMAIQKLLIGICEDVPASKDRQLQDYLKEYRKATAEIDRYVQTQLHQAKKPQTIVYRNGVII